MNTSYLIDFLENKQVSTITKTKHSYLTYHGLEEGQNQHHFKEWS